MPIRINFLAEEQAADDLRRQDPVKRAILGGGVLVVLTLAAWGYFLMKASGAGDDLAKQKDLYGKLEKPEKEVKDNLRKIGDMENKLGALLQLATNRFAWGPVLNAFQSASVENVQVTGFKGLQEYRVVAPVPPKKDTKDKLKPGSSTEVVVLYVDGYGTGSKADAIKYKDTLANAPYFKENVRKEKGWLFKGLDDVVVPGEKKVDFKLEGYYPEKVRSNE